MMESFVTKDGKKLRRGYTTGSCAAAAAKAAAIMLLEHRCLENIHLLTPRGIGLDLKVLDVTAGDEYVSCGIEKDSGDDPDVTNGIVVYTRVEKTDTPHSIEIDGGEGVGRVTRPGLDQPAGNAAINSGPRKMIRDELLQVCEDNGYRGGLRVTVSVPSGAEIAKKTFNPRLGIVGGISILGTTGIVEPMSDEAVVETIKAELSVRAAAGKKYVLFTPGNYGADFVRDELNIDPGTAVTTSNFIGDAFLLAAEAGFEGAVLVGHIGKVVKLAGGMFNTHSRYGDCRAEIFAAHAGASGASEETVKRLMNSAMTDDMLSILDEAGLREKVMSSITEKIGQQLSALSARYSWKLRTGVIAFSKVYGTLGMTGGADKLLDDVRKEI
ncbi:MAG: cobalamin biosynthesis protein CbiD [Clostridia bacterium]|nr:cobalamin biosynthesis protein CbiD [Clostridia bacterium]